ncbi:MAG: VanZ family protein [Acidimicrobiia bacterium]|nr:VanZ family protein [Acidimicrobiia bacterium]
MMTLTFTSERERRLWIGTGLVVAAIYSTLGLARVLAEEFRQQGILEAAFTAAFVMILFAIGSLALRVRPGGLEIGVALGVVAVYALVFIRMAIPEERTHVIEYGVVAVLIHEAMGERRANGGAGWSPTVVAIGLALTVGTIDELIQLFLPSRVFDVADIFTNGVSAVMAVLAKLALSWAAGRRRQRRADPA